MDQDHRIIAIDGSPAAKAQKTGVEWYVYHTLRAMNALRPELHVYVYTHQPLSFELQGNWENIVLKRPWYGWKRRWSRALKQLQPDVIWVPGDGLPPSLPKGAKVVATAHDIGWQHVPETFSAKDRRRLERIYQRYVRECDHIMTVSEATRQDVLERFGAEPNQVTTVLLGLDNVDGRWHPRAHNSKEVAAVKDRYQIPGSYVLFVGRLEAKKGIERALKGFLNWRRGIGAEDDHLRFVLAGKPGAVGYEAVQSLTSSPDVMELGYVPDEDLPALMAGASLFVFPSLYEGFGIPLLEAMASGVPVACSEIPTNREIAQYHDGKQRHWTALFKDATATGWKHLFAAVFDEEGEVIYPVEKIVENGKRRAAELTWEKTARETLEILCNI